MNFCTLFIYFVIYSILGWIAEVIYCRVLGGKFTNRGFLNGPYCPIYGFGALIIVLSLEKFTYSPVLVFLLGMLLTSALEYITSFLMEKIFNAKWWDYSNMKFNINGRVCLLNSTEFAVLGLLLTYLIHPKITNLVSKIPNNILPIIVQILLFILIFDFIVTLYTILNLKQKLKQIKAVTDEIIKNKRDSLQDSNVIKSLESVKNDIIMKTSIFHNRILDAFPEIEFKLQNIQLTELKSKIRQRFENKKIIKKLNKSKNHEK